MGLQQQLSRVFFQFSKSLTHCLRDLVFSKLCWTQEHRQHRWWNLQHDSRDVKSGALEGAMDMCAFVRVAEMSAAHKAFWLPLSQQSDTASDLGLIRSSIHNRKIAHVEKLLEHVGTYLLINVWCPSRFNNPDISRLMTHTYSKLTSWISRLGL